MMGYELLIYLSVAEQKNWDAHLKHQSSSGALFDSSTAGALFLRRSFCAPQFHHKIISWNYTKINSNLRSFNCGRKILSCDLHCWFINRNISAYNNNFQCCFSLLEFLSLSKSPVMPHSFSFLSRVYPENTYLF